jgi:beta-lactamase regulating signal transducer with metallopeptidase domain
MNIVLNLHTFMQATVEHMLNGSVQGLAIAMLAFIAMKMAARKSAGIRFAVCFATLVGIAAPSFVTFTKTGSTVPQAIHPELSLPSMWASYLFGLWAVGVVVGLTRIAVGLREVSHLRRSSHPIDISALDPLLQQTLIQFHLRRAVELRVSDELCVPTAIGFFKPAVLLPAWALRDLPPVELNAVLTHELAHLRRWDDWTKLAEKLIGAMLFFHPAIWWIQARLGLEREIACDDLVLASAGDARSYAECLISVAERSRMRNGLALALAAISRVRQTSIRIAQILDPQRSATRAASTWKPAAAMVTVLSAATLALGPHVPILVSFHDEAPPANATSVRMVPAVYSPEAGLHVVPARIVPARLEVSAQPQTLRMSSRQTVKAVRVKKHPRVVLTTAKVHPQQLRITRAALTRDSVPGSITQPSTVLVIFENRQVDASGSFTFTLCIWRFNTEQKNATASDRIASKSI